METLAVQMEIIWPLLLQRSVTGPAAEAQLSRYMLSFGVAVIITRAKLTGVIGLVETW
ncbi:MAG: hypothetical protein ABJB86_04475 [Bacteroidota bacterium]